MATVNPLQGIQMRIGIFAEHSFKGQLATSRQIRQMVIDRRNPRLFSLLILPVLADKPSVQRIRNRGKQDIVGYRFSFRLCSSRAHELVLCSSGKVVLLSQAIIGPAGTNSFCSWVNLAPIGSKLLTDLHRRFRLAYTSKGYIAQHFRPSCS